MSKRLTETAYNGYELPNEDFEKAIAKLGRVEDEEENCGLPIELSTIFKALYEGIKVKTKNGIKHYKGSLLAAQADALYSLVEGGTYDKSNDTWKSNCEYILDTTIFYEDYGDTWVCESEDFR